MLLEQLGERPWRAIQPSVAEVLRPALPELIDHALDAIAWHLPSLGQDLAGVYGHALREGIRSALEHFLDLLGKDAPALDEHLEQLYRSFGAREDRHGRSMEALLAAYRMGSRVTWDRFAASAVEAGTDSRQLIRLAEAIFAYTDELSSTSALGFAQAQIARAGHRDAARQRLADAILNAEALTAPRRVAELAAHAAWPLPESVAAAVFGPQEPERLVMSHPDVLISRTDEEVRAVIPEAVLRRHAVKLASAGQQLYVGTLRPLDRAATSLTHAQALRDLARRGVIPTAVTTLAEEHLPLLVLQADPGLLGDLRARVLAPLDGVPAGRRELLAATLRSWLMHDQDRAATARELVVHPQTVSYRMQEIKRIFGQALSDPQQRFALQLALAAPPGLAGPVSGDGAAAG